jgi:tetratricopeptide (TPR) repeat protein
MKAIGYLIIMEMLLLSACNDASGLKKRYAPNEEQYVAHEFLTKANNVSTDDNEQRMLLFDKAIYHFANIVVRSDANDTLRADALFTLRWIEAYVKHDYEQALQYLNQYLELVGPNHESFPTCLAYKADDLWHFGAQDSALHYAYLALEAPHTPNDAIEYICHHILWNIYDSREMPDSASRHKALHMKIRESRVFEPMSMEQLKSQLQADVIAPTHERHTIIPIAVVVTLLLIGIYVIFRILKRRSRPSAPDVATAPVQPLLTDAQRLLRALGEGYHVFEHTAMCADVATMQINERELPPINYDTTRTMEHILLHTFSEACRTLLDSGDLNDQELICCLCIYLGYSNTIIAHLGSTTAATIRKRKERIRKKLPTELYEVLCGSNIANKS